MTSLVFPIPPIHGLTPSNVDFEKKRQPLKYSNARIFFKCMKESATAWKNLIKYIFKWNKDIFTDHDILYWNKNVKLEMWSLRQNRTRALPPCPKCGKSYHLTVQVFILVKPLYSISFISGENSCHILFSLSMASYYYGNPLSHFFFSACHH
jgi:hypothetical protein